MYRLLASALAASVTGLSLLAAPGHASVDPAGDVTLRPERLERGHVLRGPHFDGSTLVDGAVRITVRGSGQRVLATAPDDGGYVVQALTPNGARWRTLRVAETTDPVLLARGRDRYGVVASTDGDAVAVAVQRTATRTRIEVRSTLDGVDVARRTFRGYADLLGFSDNRVVVGGDLVGGVVWSLVGDTVRQLTADPAYAADLDADRIATFDGDPNDDGCSVVAELDRPAVVLWRSCHERVTAFSPGGTRMATIALRSDGIGPDRVVVRGAHGRRLAGYRAGLVFGAIGWRGERRLVLDVYGLNLGATVRCTVRRCTRVTDLVHTPVG